MYRVKLSYVIVCMIVGIVIWTLLGIGLRKRIIWKYANYGLMLIGLYGIALYTILGRHASAAHRFILWNDPAHNEFLREMVMNLFLYFPLGLALANVLHSYQKAIIIGLLLSVSIEFWQFWAGTGVAQMTDVICNLLGVVLGGVTFLLVNKRGKQ